MNLGGYKGGSPSPPKARRMKSKRTCRALVRTAVVWAALASAFIPPAADAAPLANPFAALHWRSIGPAVSGGRAAAIAGTDDDPFLYFVGTAGGGVFRTKDGGAHWDDVWAGRPVGSIGAVAIAPHHRDVVWVGTGEANPRNDVSYGDGVYLSRDGGTTWQHRGLSGTSQIARIVVDPRDPNAALVAALGDVFADSPDRGVYRTTDGGRTWTKTLFVGPSSGASDLASSAKRPNVVFAGIWEYRRTGWSGTSGGPLDGLYRSVDDGATWTKLTGHGLPSGDTGRVGVAVAPGDPNRVYAIIESTQGLLWRSDDGGDTWRRVSSDTLLDQRPFYYTHLYVDPTNADHLLAVSVELAESRDGGKTWRTVSSAVHGDHHDLWWAADGRRIANANDGGTAISIDGAKTWEWRNNYASGQIYRVAFDSEVPYDVCVGLQDNSGWCGPSTDASGSITDRDWLNVGGGDATWVVPDPADDRYVWIASGGGNYGGELGLYDKRSAQYTDISPYVRDTNGIGTADLPYRFNWESPLAFSPRDPHVAYFGGNVVWRTDDRGKHWKPISGDLTLDEKAHQQATGGITHDVTGAEVFDTILDIAPSSVDPDVLWVGTDDGLVHLTRDGGAHWTDVTMRGVGPYGRVATIEASHWRASQAFAIVDRHYTGDRAPYLFETDDFGATWRSLSAGLPAAQFARTIRQDPVDPSLLYAGLENSVWASFDGGATWRSLQLNLPAASVRDLRIQPREDDLIAATHGRSAWILDDVTPLQQLGVAQKAGTYLFAPRAAYELITGPSGTPSGGPSSFSGDARDAGALLSYYLSKPASAVTIDIVDTRGHRVRRLSSTAQADDAGVDVPGKSGVNRVAWDLTYDAPSSWHAAPKWNRDAIAAPPVPAGRYTVVLHVDGHSYARPLEVRSDPHAPWTAAEESAWRSMMLDMTSRMSAIDDMLNSLDGLDKQLDTARVHAKSIPSLVEQIAGVRSQAAAVRAALTSDPRNDQDDDFLPDMLRERLQALWEAADGARVAPTPAETVELGDLATLQAQASANYGSLMREKVPALDAALTKAGLAALR